LRRLLAAEGFLEFGGMECVIEPSDENDEYDQEQGHDVGAGAFGKRRHGNGAALYDRGETI
jgi:hypothetical protein